MAKFFNYLSLACIIAIGVIIAYASFEWYTGALTRHPKGVSAVDINSKNTIVAASDNKLFFWNNEKVYRPIAGASKCS